MSYLLDDIARILASPIPRRQALRLLGGILAGGILSTLGVKQAAAQQESEDEKRRMRHTHMQRGPAVLQDGPQAVLCTEG